LSDERLLEPALAGTTRLFLLTGNEPGFGEIQRGVVRAAEALGVRHVVKLSALGASDHSNSSIAREHWWAEQALQQTAMGWTLLRPHAFMQNWLGEVAETVRAEGVIYSPIGDGRVPFIDKRDIAVVALRVQLSPEQTVGTKYYHTVTVAAGSTVIDTAVLASTSR